MMVQIFNIYIITVKCFPWGIITKQKFLLIFYFIWQIYKTDSFQCLLRSQQISRFIKGELYFRFETKNHTRTLKTKTKNYLRKSFRNKISESKQQLFSHQKTKGRKGKKKRLLHSLLDYFQRSLKVLLLILDKLRSGKKLLPMKQQENAKC